VALSTLGPASGRLGPDRSRRDLSAPWRHVDVVLLVCVLALGAMGVLMVYSATRGPTDPPETSFLVRQGMFFAVGIGVMVVATVVDYRRLRDWAWLLYGATMVLLFGVLSPFGQQSKGAQAWFGFGSFQLQPAEFAKLTLILALGSLLAMWAGDIDLRRLAVLLVVSGAPMGLILLQPDLGTVLVLVSIVLGMLLVAGLRLRYILALTLVGLVVVLAVLNSSVLKQYQRDRLTAFLDPASNVEATYNVNQSQVAIATGRTTGDGLFNGRQTQLGFVPEQQTDFIFTAVGEELGFAGGATVLALYGVVMWRVWRAAQLSRDQLGTLLCVGVLSMLVFQVFENVGMAMGIMPVTGIPLPLLSYGGSSMLATFAALGLVLNVHMRRFR
jgi:rod shape determining protein RodA